MKVKVSDSTLELVVGDITKQDTEAIVNAANKRLAPGGVRPGVSWWALGIGFGFLPCDSTFLCRDRVAMSRVKLLSRLP